MESISEYQLAEYPVLTAEKIAFVKAAALNSGINIGMFDLVDSFYSDQPELALVAGRWLKWNPLVKGRTDQTLWLARKLKMIIEFNAEEVIVTEQSGKMRASEPYSVYDEEYALAIAVLQVACYLR